MAWYQIFSQHQWPDAKSSGSIITCWWEYCLLASRTPCWWKCSLLPSHLLQYRPSINSPSLCLLEESHRHFVAKSFISSHYKFFLITCNLWLELEHDCILFIGVHLEAHDKQDMIGIVKVKIMYLCLSLGDASCASSPIFSGPISGTELLCAIGVSWPNKIWQTPLKLLFMITIDPIQQWRWPQCFNVLAPPLSI